MHASHVILLLCVALVAPAVLADASTTAPVVDAATRIVTLGDSVTDGNTWPSLLRQALAAAGKPVATVVNAGVGNDESADMLARLDQTVLRYHPTLVTLSAGVNDALHKARPAAEYEKNVRQIVATLHEHHVPMILMTTTILGPKPGATGDALLAEYNQVLRKLAAEYGYPVAEVNQLMTQARDAGQDLLSADQVHPNLAGQRVLARAVLDAIGCRDVKLPDPFTPVLLPGVITRWQVRVAPDKTPLTPEAISQLKPDESWTTVTLPETEKPTNEWRAQTQAEGFAQSLGQTVGKSAAYQAVASVESNAEKNAFLNIGAAPTAVWLNGKQVYKNEKWTGYHYGKERIPVQLTKGTNTIVIETGPEFIIGITDTDQW
jgi:lysophospholipase L1-like esterase